MRARRRARTRVSAAAAARPGGRALELRSRRMRRPVATAAAAGCSHRSRPSARAQARVDNRCAGSSTSAPIGAWAGSRRLRLAGVVDVRGPTTSLSTAGCSWRAACDARRRPSNSQGDSCAADLNFCAPNPKESSRSCQMRAARVTGCGIGAAPTSGVRSGLRRPPPRSITTRASCRQRKPKRARNAFARHSPFKRTHMSAVQRACSRESCLLLAADPSPSDWLLRSPRQA